MKHPYLAPVRNLERLREWSGLASDWDELDRYLCLTGQCQHYRKWERDPEGNPRPRINTESAALLSHPSHQERADAATLMGSL